MAAWWQTGPSKKPWPATRSETGKGRDKTPTQQSRRGSRSRVQFAEFFQSDRDGTAKGIVVIDPNKETWA